MTRPPMVITAATRVTVAAGIAIAAATYVAAPATGPAARLADLGIVVAAALVGYVAGQHRARTRVTIVRRRPPGYGYTVDLPATTGVAVRAVATSIVRDANRLDAGRPPVAQAAARTGPRRPPLTYPITKETHR